MDSAAPTRPLPKKARRYFSLLCLLAAVAAAVSVFSAPLEAQEPAQYEYVDLVMLREYLTTGGTTQVRYRVRNNGSAAATGVTISFLLEKLQAGTFDGAIPPTTKTGTTQSFTMEAGTIPPGEIRTVAQFSTIRHSAISSGNVLGVINAKVSSLEPEPGILSANNAIKLHSFGSSDALTDATYHMTDNKLTLLLSVGELRPAAGDEVSFELTAENDNTSGDHHRLELIANAKVIVELSRGLKFKTGWNPPNVSVAPDRQSATWSAPDTDTEDSGTEGSWHPNTGEIEIEAQLTGDSLDDIPLEERCITAWVADSIPPPSPNYILGSLKQCLGDEPTVVLNSGVIYLLTVHNCVKVNNQILDPCRDSGGDGVIDNKLELVVPVKAATARSYGIGRYAAGHSVNQEALARPDGAVVQVKDPEGRRADSSNIVWNSGSQSTGSSAVGLFPGVILDVRLPYDDFTNKNYSFSISDMTTGGKPGSMKAVGAAFKTAELLNVDKSSQPTFSGDPGGGTIPAWYEFGELGTYTMKITVGHSEGSASGLYTFHVGPIAELEVRDGGPGYPPSGNRAFSIVAVNNGPDTAPAAKVTLTGLPRSPRPDFTATRGTLAFDATADGGNGAWVWTIGKLVVTDATRGGAGREGEILTIAAGSSSEISASIENTQDYEVCIDSSGNDVAASTESACTSGGDTWHSTDYYDYDDSNDTTTIAARPGAGSALRSSQATAGLGLSWPARSGAVSYGIEVSEDGGATWRLLQHAVRGTGYTHTGIPVGATRHYQVHAVDRLGNRSLPFARTSAVAGRVSQETSPAGAPEKMALSATAASREVIQLTWVEPADYGSDITGYTLQAASGRSGPWTNVDPQPGPTTWPGITAAWNPIRASTSASGPRTSSAAACGRRWRMPPRWPPTRPASRCSWALGPSATIRSACTGSLVTTTARPSPSTRRSGRPTPAPGGGVSAAPGPGIPA